MGFRRSLVRIQSPRHDGRLGANESYAEPSFWTILAIARVLHGYLHGKRPSVVAATEGPNDLPVAGRLEVFPCEGRRSRGIASSTTPGTSPSAASRFRSRRARPTKPKPNAPSTGSWPARLPRPSDPRTPALSPF